MATPNWNVLVRRPGESWLPLWTSNRSEEEARGEYGERTQDAFFGQAADYRLVQGPQFHWEQVARSIRTPGVMAGDFLVPQLMLDLEGAVHGEHLRG